MTTQVQLRCFQLLEMLQVDFHSKSRCAVLVGLHRGMWMMRLQLHHYQLTIPMSSWNESQPATSQEAENNAAEPVSSSDNMSVEPSQTPPSTNESTTVSSNPSESTVTSCNDDNSVSTQSVENSKTQPPVASVPQDGSSVDGNDTSEAKKDEAPVEEASSSNLSEKI
jgi:hypothetical protein